MNVTAQLLKAWVETVLKPQIAVSMREGIPLDKLGGALIGYGVTALRSGGMSDDEIRRVVEAALAPTPE